jgi:uncharacterized protein YndB with AHSA1/START domain
MQQAILSETSLALARRLRAPAEQVFDAWLDPAKLRLFLCPGDVVLGRVEVDARIGGDFLIEMLNDGRPMPHIGRYEVIDRPRRLVFTWNSPHTDGDTRVELEFAPRGGETLLALRHERLPDARRAAMHSWGWSIALTKLSDALAPRSPEEDFTLTLEMTAPPSAVYAALTTKSGIASWWTRDCEVEERVGGLVAVRFPKHDFSATMTVTRLEPDRLLEWTCIACSHPASSGYADRADWVGTRLRFELTPSGQGTRLVFTHKGLLPLECRESCIAGWTHFLGESLRDLLAAGSGMPAEAA